MNIMASHKAVLGLLATRSQAETVVAELQRRGFSNNDISVLFPDKTGTRDFAHEQHTKAPEGALAGAGAGGVIGGTLGLLAGIGLLAIPGVGPFIAAGPIMASLSGIAAGAAVGGIAGGLIGMGIPEVQAKLYEGKIKGGNILVSAHIDDGEMQKIAKKVFDANGATDVVTVGEASVPSNDAPKAHYAR